MCVLTVCTFDHVHASGQSEEWNWKRGDVVQVTEDKADVGAGFKNNPDFRLVRVPGEPAKDWQKLCAPETELFPDPLGAKVRAKPVRKCLRKFDLDAAEALVPKVAPHKPITIAPHHMPTLHAEKPPLLAEEVTDGANS